jgi:acyl-CoA synthetase (AMP-forming)/AMP-acid ligase II
MQGLMMDYPLTVNTIFRRAETMAGRREIVWRRADRTLHRYTYDDFARRTRQFAGALRGLGLRAGDRVATLGWNHAQHLEAYFGIPLAGGVLHTLNLRLHPDELAYIVSHAGDRIVVVDECLMPLWEKVRSQIRRSGRRSRIRIADCRIAADCRCTGPSRERRSSHVLHDRHHRKAKGRRVLTPFADAPHPGALPGPLHGNP